MKANEKKISKKFEGFCIFCAISVLLINIMTMYFVYAGTMDKTIFSIVRYALLGFLLFKIIAFDVKYYSKKSFLICTGFFLLLLVSSFITDDRLLLQSYILILSMYRVNIKKLLKWSIISIATVFVIIVALSLLGVIPDRIFVRVNGIERHSLGFRWCTAPAIFGWSLTGTYLFLRQKNVKLFEWVILAAVNIIIFLATDTRLEFIFSIICIIFSIMYKYGLLAKISKLLNIFAYGLPAILLAGSVFFAYSYNPEIPVLKQINDYSSGRLELSHEGITEYGVSLIGQSVEWVGQADIYEGTADNESFNTIDNSYLLVSIKYGVITCAIILVGYMKLNKYAFMSKDYYLLALLCLRYVHAFIEPHLFLVTQNLILFLFVIILTGYHGNVLRGANNEA